MLDGIYHVAFSSGTSAFGEGIAVFKGASVNGGDHGYTYSGTKNESGTSFASTLAIKRWNPSAHSIFGPVNEFSLELSGSTSGANGFLAQGHVVGQPHLKITVRGKYLAAAA
jgi:hypothetical protein